MGKINFYFAVACSISALHHASTGYCLNPGGVGEILGALNGGNNRNFLGNMLSSLTGSLGNTGLQESQQDPFYKYFGEELVTSHARSKIPAAYQTFIKEYQPGKISVPVTEDSEGKPLAKPVMVDSPRKHSAIAQRYIRSSVIPSEMDVQVVAMYFSASWCPPCQKYTKSLLNLYKALKDGFFSFEIVLMGQDDSEEAYYNYFSQMPWLAVPFSNKHIIEKISRGLNVSSIPSLVFLNRRGEIFERNGISALGNHVFITSLPLLRDPSAVNVSPDAIFGEIYDLEIPTQQKLTGLKSVHTILQNLIQNPGNGAYTAIRKNTKVLHEVLPSEKFITLLKTFGFLDDGQYLTIPLRSANKLSSLDLETLEGVIVSLSE